MKTLRTLQLFLVANVLSQIATAAGDPLNQWREIEDTGNSPGLAMRYGQGKWVGFRGSSIVTSTNRTDWQTTMFFGPDEYASDLEFANGLWVIAGTRQSTNIFILTSTNAVTWSSVTNFGGTEPRIRRGPNEWLIMSSGGLLLRSTDGQSWAESAIGNAPAGSNFGWIYDIAYGDGRWLGIVYESGPGEVLVGSLAISTNRTVWEWWQRPAPMFGVLKFAHGFWFGITHQPGWYGCGAVIGDVVTSVDGTNWVTRTSGDGLGQIALVNNRLITTATLLPLCRAETTNAPVFPMFEAEPIVSLQQSGPSEIVVTRASGIPVVVEASGDLGQWHTLTNLPLGQAVQPLTDQVASSLPYRFYRARTP